MRTPPCSLIRLTLSPGGTRSCLSRDVRTSHVFKGPRRHLGRFISAPSSNDPKTCGLNTLPVSFDRLPILLGLASTAAVDPNTGADVWCATLVGGGGGFYAPTRRPLVCIILFQVISICTTEAAEALAHRRSSFSQVLRANLPPAVTD